MKEKNIKTYIYAIIVVLSFILVAIGATFASLVFVGVLGNNKAGNIEIKTATVTAAFQQTNGFNDTNVFPGWTNYIEFEILNTSKTENAVGRYSLMFEIEKNDIDDDNFVYSLTGTSTKDGKEISTSSTNQLVTLNSTELKVPTSSSSIGTYGIINTGVTHKYRLDIKLKETGENQNDLQGKTFIGKIVAVGK